MKNVCQWTFSFHIWSIIPDLYWYITGSKYRIPGKHDGDTRTWHFKLLEMAWHQPQTGIVSLIQLSHVMSLKKKSNFQYPDLKVHNIFYRNVSFVIFRLTFPTTARVSIIILWIYAHFLSTQWSLLSSRRIFDRSSGTNLPYFFFKLLSGDWSKILRDASNGYPGSCRGIVVACDRSSFHPCVCLPLRQSICAIWVSKRGWNGLTV